MASISQCFVINTVWSGYYCICMLLSSSSKQWIVPFFSYLKEAQDINRTSFMVFFFFFLEIKCISKQTSWHMSHRHHSSSKATPVPCFLPQDKIHLMPVWAFARTTVKIAFGRLKSCWRVLLKKGLPLHPDTAQFFVRGRKGLSVPAGQRKQYVLSQVSITTRQLNVLVVRK